MIYETKKSNTFKMKDLENFENQTRLIRKKTWNKSEYLHLIDIENGKSVSTRWTNSSTNSDKEYD